MKMKTDNTDQKKGFAALVSTAAILGTFGVLIRALAETFSDSGQVFARSFFATLIIASVVLYKKLNPFKLPKGSKRYVLAFSVVFPLSILCFTISANLEKVSNSLFMLYVGSLASTAIVGKLFFKEKFGFKHILALVLAVIGLSFFVYPFSFETLSVGILLGIASGIFEGMSHSLRKLMKDVKREVVVFYQSLSGVVLASVLLLFSNEVFIKEFHLSSVFVAMLFGLLLVSIGYLLVYGFGNFDVNLGTIILATELFFALVINALILREYPTANELVGGFLIFAGTAVTSLKLGEKKQEANEKTG